MRCGRWTPCSNRFLTAEEDGQDIVLKAITIEPGIVPPWSRAGTFLIWMGKTPFRCEWGGFPYPYASFAAADPRMPFPSSDGVMRCTTVIEREQRTPADVCRCRSAGVFAKDQLEAEQEGTDLQLRCRWTLLPEQT